MEGIEVNYPSKKSKILQKHDEKSFYQAKECSGMKFYKITYTTYYYHTAVVRVYQVKIINFYNVPIGTFFKRAKK